MNDKDRLCEALDNFYGRMLNKLLEKHDQGYIGWNSENRKLVLQESLMIHATRLIQGDASQAVDVANLAMFLSRLK